MSVRSTPSVSIPVVDVLPTALLLAIPGWGGLYWVTQYTAPNGGTRWLLFFTGVLALTGTILPGITYLNRRFPGNPPAEAGALLRQALWIGIYFPTLVWLQIGRVLNPALALLLALGILLIEMLLRLRERSLWRPAPEEPPAGKDGP